jgi:hypothetical protein
MSGNTAKPLEQNTETEALENEVPTLLSTDEVKPNASNDPFSEDSLAAELAAARKSNAAPEVDTQAFDKVRELLMGETIQSLRDDLHCSHRIILHRVETLHKSITKRMDNMDKKVTALNFTMNQEVQDREELEIAIRSSQEETVKTIRTELGDVKTTLTESADKLQSELSSTSSEQADALHKLKKQLQETIDRQCSTLTDEKMNRDALAKVLSNMAAEISGPVND